MCQDSLYMEETDKRGLFERIIANENLYLAAHRAALGKRFRDNIALWRLDMEAHVVRLHEDLKAGKYRHGRYRVFQIYDPKKRFISVAPFRDRVVHHAFHDVIEEFMDKRFIHDSYACRKNKGTHVALDRAHSFLKANRYCFHGDIRQYFPSIDHTIMKGLLRRDIHDARVLSVLDHIIDSARTSSVPGTDRGLPIGNLTSQFFANLYLHELDFFVKNTLRCRYYLRYMDDFLVFENDRVRLAEIRSLIGDFLRTRLQLDLHAGKSQIFDTARGIKFLGFRLYPDHRRLATAGVRRFRRRLKKFRYLLAQGFMDEARIAQSVLCWRAHSSYANASRLRSKLAQETEVWSERVSEVLAGG